jgi:thiamine pyrophosphate-dependent acetolactate synthase large subunit-like protein
MLDNPTKVQIGAELVVRALEDQGVTHVFGPGRQD